MYAAYVGHEKACRFLIERRADLEIASLVGQTALMLAASCGNENVCNLLLQSGSHLKTTDNQGWNCLVYAANCNHTHLVKLLLKKGASPNQILDAQGNTPFLIACDDGNELIVRSYIDVGGSDLKSTDNQGWNCLVHAASHNHAHLVNLLLKKGASPNQILDVHGNTPFLIACADVNELIVQSYIDAGADMNYCNKNGDSPMKIAADCKHMGIHNLLKTRKAFLNAQKSCHKTLEKTVSNPVQQINCLTNGIEFVQNQMPASSQFKGRSYSTKVGKSTQQLDQANVQKPRFTNNQQANENRPSLPAAQPLKIKSIEQNGVEHGAVGASSSNDKKFNSLPSSLAELFEHLQLAKFMPVFEQQEIDLPLFLQLTDLDLKEIGIKLFGPRKKMTNVIARWHRHMPDLEPVERAYANYHRAISEEYCRKNVELNNELTITQELAERYKQDIQKIETKMLNACASGRLCNTYVKECKKQAQLIIADFRRNNFDPRAIEHSFGRICALCDQILLKLAEGNLI